MYGQMTAGTWIYIGTQGILQGTYETLRCRRSQALRRHARGTARRDGRPRRHGRRPAARGDDERGDVPGRSRSIDARIDGAWPRATSTRSAPTLDAAHRSRGRAESGRRGALDGRGRQRRRPARPRSSRAASCPTCSPTRRRRTTSSTATCRTGCRYAEALRAAPRRPGEYVAESYAHDGRARARDARAADAAVR